MANARLMGLFPSKKCHIMVTISSESQVPPPFCQKILRNRPICLVFVCEILYNIFVSYSREEACIVKGIKVIISLISAIIVVAAAICAVVIFQEELMKFLRTCCDYCKKAIQCCPEAPEEFDDFADL